MPRSGKGKILVTDKLFIFAEHEDRMQAAGYEIVRMLKTPTEADLIAALDGVVAYIVGGVERVTSNAIERARDLRALGFTGSGYAEFIVGHAAATRRGIPIVAAKGANDESVAEFALALILLMSRQTRSLIAPNVPIGTSKSARDTTIGIIGFGAIGSKLAQYCLALGFTVIATPRQAERARSVPGVAFVSKSELLSRSDVISLHVSDPMGHHALNAADISNMKPGVIVVNVAFPDAVDQGALVSRLLRREIVAAFDKPLSVDTSGVDADRLVQSKYQTAFDTFSSNKRVSDWVTDAVLNLLDDRFDPLVVNPEFVRYKKWNSSDGKR